MQTISCTPDEELDSLINWMPFLCQHMVFWPTL